MAILAADLFYLKHSLSSASVKDGRLVLDLDEHTGLHDFGSSEDEEGGEEGELRRVRESHRGNGRGS
uniref:Uncharacterized protein n=1 Tax=Chromera velia CCMP2878 TaxID=1169474 RepID=A0A0G4GS02_9ALVE|eukprot:Cvel_5113.t1-p1 / transcript=Cvel_5113.t1 / gene=Cvel_5113 / organism=Chromera_velia_CCMP2878 / gene_product=hypothetical protein / transcript_product=hypothetical protein / location=Cvel_scaffold234:11425-11622(+) / protein_length=66 / sequence_SO=supercontig / SO=protein_coding / is_pseudo=false